jgi:hypothetical protein
MVKAVEIVGFTVINIHFVVDGEVKVLKIVMFAMIGEKDISKDKTSNSNYFVIFMPHGKVSR